jgi:hypothetical protein
MSDGIIIRCVIQSDDAAAAPSVDTRVAEHPDTIALCDRFRFEDEDCTRKAQATPGAPEDGLLAPRV